jgi:hypothetical protein
MLDKDGNRIKSFIFDWHKIKFDVPNYIKENPKEFFNSRLNRNDRLILAYLLILNERFIGLHPSQSGLANMIDLSRKTVNRQMKILEQNKLILTNYRSNHVSSYRLAPFLRNSPTKKIVWESLKDEINTVIENFKFYKDIIIELPKE